MPKTKSNISVSPNDQLAAKIADAIFTDGLGRKGQRLVFEYQDGKQDSTGYSRFGVQTIIARYLKQNDKIG